MLAFVRNAGIRYKCFCVDKRYVNRRSSIHDQLLRAIVGFLVSHAKQFDEYEVLKVYYDNGQSQITSLLKEAFLVYSAKTVFMPDVRPYKHRLFQATDLICTMELLLAKIAAGDRITASEEWFFGGVRGFNLASTLRSAPNDDALFGIILALKKNKQRIHQGGYA